MLIIKIIITKILTMMEASNSHIWATLDSTFGLEAALIFDNRGGWHLMQGLLYRSPVLRAYWLPTWKVGEQVHNGY